MMGELLLIMEENAHKNAGNNGRQQKVIKEILHMTVNIGKRLENNFRDSIPNDVMYHRLKDSAQSFGGTNNLRFSSKNPCDCLMFYSPILFALEMKSVGTSSISFERTEDEPEKVIRYHQIEGLRKYNEYRNMISGFIFNFRHKDNTETCYFQHISDFDKMIDDIAKKSFNERDLQDYNPLVIENTRLKVNYRYNVSKFIEDIKERYNII